jgi:hypothetical protein
MRSPRAAALRLPDSMVAAKASSWRGSSGMLVLNQI